MQQISNKRKKAFTLVELIIVITILAILGTIAYISFQGYTKDARDGVRMSDIRQIYNGLSIYKTQTEKTLLPDNYINIQSGTTVVSYQGYAGTNVLRTLKISGGKDPGTKDYYIYTTDVNTKKAQLMTYMETSDKDVQLLSKMFLNQAEATTNTGYYADKKIYVYGDKIGILTDSNKVPLQETTSSTGINIITTTTPITTYFGGNVYSGGLSTNTGITLINQINGAITGKLPCNGTTYNSYIITSLQDSQSGSFTKVINNSPLIQTGSIVATCNNGTLNYSGESTQNGCISGYIWNGSSCIQVNYWSTSSSTFPSVVAWSRGGSYGNSIYSVGGLLNSSISNKLYEFNTITNTFTEKAVLPISVYAHGVTELNGKIYVMGGGNGCGNSAGCVSSLLYEYNISTNTWSQKASMNYGRWHLASTSTNGKLYAVGGVGYYDNSNGNKMEEYDPNTNTWSIKTNMPRYRYSHVPIGYNGKVYVIGGYNPSDSSLYTILDIFDSNTNTWTQGASLPVGLGTPFVTLIGNKIYVLGGALSGSSVSSKVYEYDIDLNTWTEKNSSMPTPRENGITGLVNGKIYTIGGRISGGTDTNVIDIYNP